MATTTTRRDREVARRRSQAQAREAEDLARVVSVFSHPLRPQILELVAERGEASPSEMADVLAVNLSRLSYHVRELVGAGMLRVKRTEPRRGAIAHFYGLVPRAAPQLELLQFRAAALRGHLDRVGS